MMGFLNKFKKDRPDRIGGYIGYYGLTEWWLSSFSEDERKYIVETFKPMGSSGESLIKGNIDCVSSSPSRLLFDLAGWFKKKEDRTIAFRLIGKAEELLNENSDILDIHFFYGKKIDTYYKHREVEPEAFAIAIEACKKQIAIAPKAKKAFLDEYKDSPLPGHMGFKQLAIIEEKQKNYEQAIKLCKEALHQGWSGDWEKRIERCIKKNGG
jgi:tetratricopeptide (TPR) repeat protein